MSSEQQSQRRLPVRILASGHWTGDVLIRFGGGLTLAGAAFLVARAWLVGLGLLVVGAILIAGLSWLYLRAEKAGYAHDPKEFRERPPRWRDLLPMKLVIGLALIVGVMSFTVWLRW